MEINETVITGPLGNKQASGMYRCSKDGVDGFGATPHAAYLNWLSKVKAKND